MGGSLSPVEVLLAKCQQVSEAIAGHREAIAVLTAERDGMVAELRRLGLSERAVGRLLGISGPRVNQIMNPAEGAPEVPAVAPRVGARRVTLSGQDRIRREERRARAARGSRDAPTAAELARERAEDAREDREPVVPPVRLRPPEGVPLDPTGQPCTHPKGRRSKGLCGACGTHVGAS